MNFPERRNTESAFRISCIVARPILAFGVMYRLQDVDQRISPDLHVHQIAEPRQGERGIVGIVKNRIGKIDPQHRFFFHLGNFFHKNRSETGDNHHKKYACQYSCNHQGQQTGQKSPNKLIHSPLFNCRSPISIRGQTIHARKFTNYFY